MTEIKDYRITVKVRNNRLLKAIEEAGGSPGQKWCAENGLGYGRVNTLISLKTSPINESGQLYPDAQRLCDVLNKLPEDLWSNEQLYPLEKNFSEMEMSYEQVVAMLPGEQQSYLPDFSEFENKQKKELLGKAMETLTPNERRVMHMRFYDDLTLEESAKKLDVTSERVRQIEQKALRKMRGPDRAAIYVDAIDDGMVNETHRLMLKVKSLEKMVKAP
jgi:RNA polymerase sigma factor (sigma-70 family)